MNNEERRPVLSSGTRKATFSWYDDDMSGRIEIQIDLELAFSDEEPGMSRIAAVALREFADKISARGIEQ